MKIVILLIIISLCIFLLFLFLDRGEAKFVTLAIKGKTIHAEVADTIAKRAQGLSGRAGLGENEGMLFIFDASGIRPFWMKDMKFSIDIIWITGNRVVGFEENAELPSGFTIPTYSPLEAVDRVLEVPAGSVKQWDVRVGDMIE